MTGFAFYSCEDVVDNPAKDPAQSWNYSVSVKFENFDFTAQPTDPVTGETNVYKVPTTLYVLNEEKTLMGTITTETAPAADSKTYATYAGTLTGSIGNNLIITTKIGNDLDKQDGTLASAIKNGIVQTAEVPIKIYNANSGTLTTAAAKMENTSAIAQVHTNQLNGGDKVKFSDESKSFEWTVNEDFKVDINDWWNTTTIYIAIPTNGDPEAEYTISTDGVNGYTLGATFDNTNLPLNTGKLSGDLGFIGFEALGIDLTKWDTYQREVNNATGTTNLSQWINDDKTFIITQSGEKAIDANVVVRGNGGENVAVILNNIRLEKNNYFEISNGATFDITLIGENKFEMLNLNSPFTKKGDGTWKFNQLNIGGGQYWDGQKNIPYAAEYTINEDIDLKHLSASNGAKLTIADGKKVSVINEESRAISVYYATFNIGKGATLNAESKAKNERVINIEYADFNVGEGATVSAQGYKDGYAMYLNNNNDNATNQKLNVNIGKNATVNLIGGTAESFGRGMYIRNYYNATTNITLDEGAILNATGIDRQAIYCYSNNSNSAYEDNSSVNFMIAKGAKITAEETADGPGFYAAVSGGKINFDGEGTFEAKSKGGYGMAFYNSSNFFFNGGNIIAIGGKDNPAIYGNTFTIGEKVTSFKAQKGATATLYISNGGTETPLENLVADKTKFNDETADGARTITPKAE